MRGTAQEAEVNPFKYGGGDRDADPVEVSGAGGMHIPVNVSNIMKINDETLFPISVDFQRDCKH